MQAYIKNVIHYKYSFKIKYYFMTERNPFVVVKWLITFKIRKKGKISQIFVNFF